MNGIEEEKEIPGDIQDQLEQLIAARNYRLEVLGKIVANIRDEAVSARRESGFETQWKDDEDYYDGVDEYNSSVLSDDYIKPRSIDGVLTSRKKSNEDGSTAFINITGAFTDYAAARMGDILLPANEWNYKIDPTPVPELDALENDVTPVPGYSTTYDQNGNPIQPTVADIASKRKKEISDRVEKAGTRIKDWLTECNFKSESRKVIENAAKVGAGIMKGPYPDKSIAKKFSNGALQIIETIKPVSRCISHWDFFPDMSCGENIQDGSYVIERDYLTARQLKNLIGVEGYLPDAIKKVLKEGPGKRLDQTNQALDDSDRYEVWYCYVDLDPDDMALLDDDYAEECSCMEEKPESVSAVVVLVNDTAIKGFLNPMESGEYPYDVMVWRRIAGKPFGMGVPRQGRKAQEMLNASVRALMDNMGLSAIPMIAMLRKALVPADKSWKIRKGKVWFLNEESGITDIRQAIQTLVIPSMQAELMANIELSMKFMEDITGITFLLQGQQGSAPDTVGGMNLLHQNASTVLRRCARIYDENITEPHIKRYHEYLLIDPNVPEDEKGDLKINATGSSHLVEREIQSMQLPMILQIISSNPMLEKSPKKAVDEILRAFNFDPSKFDMDEEEKQQMANAQQQTAPQVQVAQIRAQTELQKEQIRQEGNTQRMQVDTDRDTVHIQAQTLRDQQNHEYLLQKMQLDYELQLLKYANDRQITLDEAKKDLAALTMKLNLQKELAYNNPNGAEQIVTPVSEPAGRAPQGQAFQR